jgi:hypothetical protein
VGVGFADNVDASGNEMESCSTCALGRFDVRKQDAAGLEIAPVDTRSLMVGNINSLRAYRLRLQVRERCL